MLVYRQRVGFVVLAINSYAWIVVHTLEKFRPQNS